MACDGDDFLRRERAGGDGDGRKLVSGMSEAHDVLVQTDGRIVLVGAGNSGNESAISLVRLTSTGAPDGTTFDPATFAGNLVTPSAAFAPDGKIVAQTIHYTVKSRAR